MGIWDSHGWNVFFRDRGKCAYCGFDLSTSFEASCLAEIDHLRPQDHPDRDDPRFMALACSGCNRRLSQAHRLGLATVEARKAYLNRPERSLGQRNAYERMLRVKANGWNADGIQ